MTNARRYVGPIDDDKAIATKDYVDNLDDKYLLLENAFLNFQPKVGLSADEKLELYAKPNFTFLPTMCNDFVWMDNQSRYVIYFLAHDGNSYHVNLYRGYKYNLSDEFIYDNEPTIPSFLPTTEYIGLIHNVCSDYIVISTYLKSNKSYAKTYFIKTNGYSSATMWTEYNDVTTVAQYMDTFSGLFYDKYHNKYVAVYFNTTEINTVIYNSSLVEVSSSVKKLFDVTTNFNVNNIPNFSSLLSISLASRIYADYNILKNELIITVRTICWYYPITSPTQVYVYKNHWFTFNIDHYMSSDGVSNPVNTRLSDSNSTLYDYALESKGRWDIQNVIKIVYDLFAKTYRLISQNPWDYGGNTTIREYLPSWNFNYSNDLFMAWSAHVLDASPWAKNINANVYFIDDDETYQGDNCGTLVFYGRSAKYGWNWIIAKVSTTSFDTIPNTSLNNLKIKPGAWRFIKDLYLDATEQSLLTNSRICTYINFINKTPSRFVCVGPGNVIYELKRNTTNVFKYDFITTGKVLPDTISSYDASIPVNWRSDYVISSIFAGYNPGQNVAYLYVYKTQTHAGLDAGYENVIRILKVRLSDNKAIAISGYLGVDFKNASGLNGVGLSMYNTLIINNNITDTHYSTIQYTVIGNTIHKPYRTQFLNQNDIISFNNSSRSYSSSRYSYCKNIGVVYSNPTPSAVNNGYISMGTEDLTTDVLSISTHNLALTCISSLGLIVTIPSFYVFIGGFMTRSESGEFLLEANTRSYICIERDYTDPKNRNRLSKIVIYTSPVPNSFSRICIGEILTNNTDIVEQIIYET